MRSRCIIIAAVLAISGSACPSMVRCQGTAEEELARLEAQIATSGLEDAALYLAFAPEFQDLARRHPGTEVALTAKLWIIQHAYRERNYIVRFTWAGQLAEEILTEFPNSPRLTRLVELGYVFRDDQKRGILGRLATSSPHPEVRGEALLALARLDLQSNDPEAIARGRERLRDLVAHYAAVPSRYATLGSTADALLNPHGPQALAIGAQAPEISGLTHDGRPVALSAFHGKVVILEFWGKW
jgi:outer membrane protein assembly factor BamD (BamD/ComL family)